MDLNNIGFRIRQQRKRLGVPMKDIAKEIGVSVSYLSQLETGKVKPSLHTFKKLTDSLNTNIKYMLGETEKGNDNIVLTRKEDRKVLRNMEHGTELQFFNLLDGKNEMDPCIQRLNGHAISGKKAYTHKGQQFVYVLQGRIEIVVGGKKFILNKDDSIYFKSDLEHSYKNMLTEGSEILCIQAPPYF